MRTIVLIDGQNLYHLARMAWFLAVYGPSSPYAWPSYDVEKLAQALVSRAAGRILTEIRFYTASRIRLPGLPKGFGMVFGLINSGV